MPDRVPDRGSDAAGAEVSEEILVAAPAARVWELVSDITLMPRFSSELQWVAWEEGHLVPGPGAHFIGRNVHPAVGEWTTTSTIVEFDPPRRFEWAVGDPAGPAATWRFEIIPSGPACRLRHIARIGPGPSGVTMLIERRPDRARQIVADRLEQFRGAMRTTLAGIRVLAEAAPNRTSGTAAPESGDSQ